MTDALYLPEPKVAEALGRSVGWLRQHRGDLEREGFPRMDRLIGRTNRQDLEAWVARRRMVADDAGAERQRHTPQTNTIGVNFNAL